MATTLRHRYVVIIKLPGQVFHIKILILYTLYIAILNRLMQNNNIDGHLLRFVCATYYLVRVK